MNRFSPKKHFEIHGIWILSSLLFVFLFCVFIVKGIYNIDHSTLQEQANSLERQSGEVSCAVLRSRGHISSESGLSGGALWYTYDTDQYYVGLYFYRFQSLARYYLIPLNQE